MLKVLIIIINAYVWIVIYDPNFFFKFSRKNIIFNWKICDKFLELDLLGLLFWNYSCDYCHNPDNHTFNSSCFKNTSVGFRQSNIHTEFQFPFIVINVFCKLFTYWNYASLLEFIDVFYRNFNNFPFREKQTSIHYFIDFLFCCFSLPKLNQFNCFFSEYPNN